MSLSLLAPLACVFCLLSGCVGLLRPDLVARFVAIETPTPMGVLEVRCMFGGLYIGASLVCLATGSADAYLVFAAMWLVGALAKYAAIWLDQAPLAWALASASFDVLVGLALASGYVVGAA